MSALKIRTPKLREVSLLWQVGPSNLEKAPLWGMGMLVWKEENPHWERRIFEGDGLLLGVGRLADYNFGDWLVPKISMSVKSILTPKIHLLSIMDTIDSKSSD